MKIFKLISIQFPKWYANSRPVENLTSESLAAETKLTHRTPKSPHLTELTPTLLFSCQSKNKGE